MSVKSAPQRHTPRSPRRITRAAYTPCSSDYTWLADRPPSTSDVRKNLTKIHVYFNFRYGLAIDFKCELSVCNFILILKFQNVAKTTQRLKRKNATPVNASR
jgi:hypothetical protein